MMRHAPLRGVRAVVGINPASLAIGPGDLLVLKGNSASAKSTPLSLLAALGRPPSGHPAVAGHHLSNSSALHLRRFRRAVPPGPPPGCDAATPQPSR